jgi:hypothetical protein
VTSSGELYTWGQATSGRLGHGSAVSAVLPLRVATLQKIEGVAMTDCYTISIGEDGLVHRFGGMRYLPVPATSASVLTLDAPVPPTTRTTDSKRRHDDSDNDDDDHDDTKTKDNDNNGDDGSISHVPRRIESMRTIHIRSVAAAANRACFVSEEGQLWTLGQQLEDGFVLTSTPRLAVTRDIIVNYVACTPTATIVVTRNGDVFQQLWMNRSFHKVVFTAFTPITSSDISSVKDNERKGSSGKRHGPRMAPSRATAFILKIRACECGPTPMGQLQGTSGGIGVVRAVAVSNTGNAYSWKINTLVVPSSGSSGHQVGSPGLSGVSSANTPPSLTLGSSVTNATSKRSATPFSSLVAGSTSSSSSSTQLGGNVARRIEGLANVCVVDASITYDHTSLLTADGHVYAYGPGSSHGVARQKNGATIAMSRAAIRPRLVRSLRQVVRLISSDKHSLAIVRVAIPQPLESSVHDGIGVASLRSICEDEMIQRSITTQNCISAFEWAVETGMPRIAEHCGRLLLLNIDLLLEPALCQLTTRALRQLDHFLHCYCNTAPTILRRRPRHFDATCFSASAFHHESGFDADHSSGNVNSRPISNGNNSPSIGDLSSGDESKLEAVDPLHEERIGLSAMLATLTSMDPSADVFTSMLSARVSSSSQPKTMQRLRALRKKVGQAASLVSRQQSVMHPYIVLVVQILLLNLMYANRAKHWMSHRWKRYEVWEHYAMKFVLWKLSWVYRLNHLLWNDDHLRVKTLHHKPPLLLLHLLHLHY